MSNILSVKDFNGNNFYGLYPYSVKIEKSDELEDLLKEAKTHENEPFEQKLQSITNIALRAMENAYELSLTCKDEVKKNKAKNLVESAHSLEEALKEKMGCCRYQAVLFFLLSEAAKLGQKHYLESAHVSGNFHTCYNNVIDENGKMHHISIFCQSLKDKKFDYTRSKPKILHSPDITLDDGVFLSYFIDSNGNITRRASSERHLDDRVCNLHDCVVVNGAHETDEDEPKVVSRSVSSTESLNQYRGSQNKMGSSVNFSQSEELNRLRQLRDKIKASSSNTRAIYVDKDGKVHQS